MERTDMFLIKRYFWCCSFIIYYTSSWRLAAWMKELFSLPHSRVTCFPERAIESQSKKVTSAIRTLLWGPEYLIIVSLVSLEYRMGSSRLSLSNRLAPSIFCPHTLAAFSECSLVRIPSVPLPAFSPASVHFCAFPRRLAYTTPHWCC